MQLGHRRTRSAVQGRQEQLRAARRARVGSDRRRQDERQRRLRADLRHRADRASSTRACSRRRRSASSACAFCADAAVRARQPAGDVPRPEQLGGGRRLRLPAAGCPGLRLVADRRAAVQHLPGARRLPARRTTTTSTPRCSASCSGNNSVTVSYVGSRGTDLVWRRGHQRAAARLADAPAPQTSCGRSSTRSRSSGSIIEFTNDGKSWYDSVQLSFRQNSWHGINTQYNYTLSKCTDYNSATATAANAQATNPYDPANEQRAVRLRHPPQLQRRRQLRDPGHVDLAADRCRSARSSRRCPAGRSRRAQGTTRSVGPGHRRRFAPTAWPTPIYNYDLDYLFPDPTTTRSAITNAAQAFANAGRRHARHLRPQLGRRPGLRAARPEHLKEFKLASGVADPGALGDLQPDQPREPRRFPRAPACAAASFGKIGSTPDVDRGNPVHRHGRTARDAVGAEAAVLTFGLGSRESGSCRIGRALRGPAFFHALRVSCARSASLVLSLSTAEAARRRSDAEHPARSRSTRRAPIGWGFSDRRAA